ncbi:acetyltransferase [Lutimonas zeaxanthinifaciens]|uniref:acetyltransferase n=1 Tax=Lutimonas zeaxanthinifaciens TaxID=3060215 RepID=UPI00265CABD9|nr:acetyltransferase [Lutimonas sp. YSD2104]WKK67369.1 acetyltransferase [Lutimonas sp. YSD2104]
MVLYGASGHAKVVIDILKRNNINVSRILDDNVELEFLNGFPVTHRGKINDIHEELIITIGDNRIRKVIVDQNSFNYGNAIHPSSVTDNTVKIGEGSVVMAGAVINADTFIGKHCIVNTSASIDHDCSLQDYVHISPNATICGGIKIGEGTQIGAGAVIMPNLKIGEWCKIGAGAVVISDVPDGATIVGNPGRNIKI